MRRSYLLAALIAGATAEHIAHSRQSIERDLSLLRPRDATELFQPVEARTVSPEKKVVAGLQNRQRKRDDDPYDDYKEHLKHIQELQEEQEEQEQEDNDNKHNNNNSPPPGPPGGTIAGAVIGVVVAILIALALWFFLRIRPRRKQRQAVAAKEADIENGFTMTPVSSIHRDSPPVGAQSNRSLPSEHIRWAPTPYPERAPSIHTGSSMSGLALPTPALTYSPSVGTAASPPSPPSPHHQGVQQLQQQPQVHQHFNDIPSEKPPAYDAITALQSSEPQPEASAYQMGQVPIEAEPIEGGAATVCHLPVHYGGVNTSGEHMPRY
ncbi:hypothetical protein F4805DRAFT_236345 [Annulohypoxylon moriforme]|nr:hypothetical protein F4805DRAFT_236345 [Annulohypoxylon moriforme]